MAGHKTAGSTARSSARVAGTFAARVAKVRVPILVVVAGASIALTSPHQTIPWVWLAAFVPLFLGLDLCLAPNKDKGKDQALIGWWSRWLSSWWRVFACTYPAGVVFAILTGDWVTNTAHVYGSLPWPLAFGANAFGYGSLFGLELFVFLGVPFALTRHRPMGALVVVPLWCTVGQIFIPRFLYFTYGQAMFATPSVVQFADLLGSGGLNLLYLPLQMVIAFGLARWLHFRWNLYPFTPSVGLPIRKLALAGGVVVALYVLAFGYGFRQMDYWEEASRTGPQVEIVGIQPNFSLGHLASNPALSHSDRRRSIQALVRDSDLALARASKVPGVPTVLFWPESVYPRAYFEAPALREAVENWVRQRGIHLVLATQEIDHEGDQSKRNGMRAYGSAVYVGAEGMVRGVYRKIALIPFGESIPFAELIPAWARLLRAWIPQISEFTPGREHTVFTLPNGVGLAPMICFDVASESVARGMARSGARLGVVLANLAWFGRTTVTDQLGMFAQFRAIESRMPLLFLSQNGESFLLDARGIEVGNRLPQFGKGAIVRTVRTPEATSFFARHGDRVHAAYGLLLAGLLLVFPGRPGWRSVLSSLRKRFSAFRS